VASSQRTVRRSAGLLLFRRQPALSVLIAHTGGPFWARRDLAAWTIPKGEYGDDEPVRDAAAREFSEELGLPVPAGEWLDLGEVRQKNGKLVQAWAIEADLDPASIVPGTFELEWPAGSGSLRQVPEIDRVQWFTPDEARPRLFTGQQAFLDRLIELLGG
jgi:predicted NUDIX family NTP pyrophosphohydrolase